MKSTSTSSARRGTRVGSLRRADGNETGLDTPRGRLRGVDGDIATLDFAGWLLYCREDFPDEYAHCIVKTIDEQKQLIESVFQPGQGLTGSIVANEFCRDTDIWLIRRGQVLPE